MTDIIYPSHPDLTGMPTEFVPNSPIVGAPAVNVPSAPMPNPYQVQPQSNPAGQTLYPPQNYPQTGQPHPAPTHPAPTHPAPNQPSAPQSELGSDGQSQVPVDANLLQDVTWSNFTPIAASAPQTAPNPAPQLAPYSAPQPTPQTALNAAPSPAYPPMPMLQASGMQAAAMVTAMTPAFTAPSFNAPNMETDKDTDVVPLKTESKRLLGSIKQRFTSRKNKRAVKTDLLTEPALDATPNPIIDNWNAPNIQTPNAGKIAQTDGLAKMVEVSKKPRSSRLAFLLGLLSGIVLTCILLAGLDLISQKKEYATVAADGQAPAVAGAPKLEKLNDDLAETSKFRAAAEDVSGGLFLDEQLSSKN